MFSNEINRIDYQVVKGFLKNKFAGLKRFVVYLLHQNKQTTKNYQVMITNETRDNHIKMLRAIENLITLKANVKAGCEDDYDAMEREEARIPAMKAWMNANGTKADVLSWLSDRQSAWGLDSRKFIANDLYDVLAS